MMRIYYKRVRMAWVRDRIKKEAEQAIALRLC